ncbi:hypothetical protein BaRGS_00022298 [Batillaria attramentaria]|uniref:OTU domain-containing protein n=1 Tax=Batillaria attramentaria TaxID=370345 RepID=A0ABD0KHI6_9CAEN
MDPDSTEDSVYLNLATSFVAAADRSVDHSSSTNGEGQSEAMDAFDESDYEPLIRKQARAFNTSDDEPLIRKLAGSQSDFNSSDEEPLIMKQIPDIADDSADPTFLPSEESDTSRHDSESDTVDSSFPAKEAHSRKRRRKTKRQSDLLRAQAASLALTKEREENVAIHQARLDNLLSANGLTRTEIYPDGNCFFEASAFHLEETSGEELRRCLCEHLEENFGAYVPFMAQEEDDENDVFMRFLLNVSELQQPGKWSNDAADLLPRVLADWSERPVRIYTSDLFKSVLDFMPSTSSTSATTWQHAEPITLAFTVHEPSHYDACHRLARKQTPGTQHEVHIDCDVEAKDFQPTQQSTPNKYQNQIDGDSSGEGLSFPAQDDSLKSTPIQEQPKDTINITPRKQGSFQTPPKKNLSRKKKAKPETWKQNVRKSLHLQGKEYVSQTGKTVDAKCVRKIDCSKCRYDCNNRVSEEYRQELFQTFYALDTYERQKDFVCAHVRDRETVSILGTDNKPVPKKRQRCRTYFFIADGKEQRVCKKFFLATLALGEAYVDHALKNSTNGTFAGKERRGKSQPHNKASEEAIEGVRRHIESFPTVESHYTRKDTQRKYLEPVLTVKKMHDLYVQQCKEEGREPVSTKRYRQVFNNSYNLAFHVPKKDQCSLCSAFAVKKIKELATEEDQKAFEEHQERKKRARLEKEKDKAEAKEDRRKHVVTVDLQAVLQSPCGLVSQLYYRRKLSVYNFTIYSLADGEAKCYTWDESEGKRGACEIATCIYFYLSSLPDSVEEVTIYSDCCSGQNRNQYLAAALAHAAQNIGNIKNITHKYLESGHTQMECDSMHAAITFAKRTTPIYTPSCWDIILRMARRTRPYLVVPIKFTDILDFKSLAASTLRNTKTDITGQKVNWLKLKALRFEKSREGEILYKTSFDQHSYQTIKVVGGSKRGRAVPYQNAIPHLYGHKLPISEAKKADLLYLCSSGVIPEEYHGFYKSLPASSAAMDRLPQPDISEQDNDSD